MNQSSRAHMATNAQKIPVTSTNSYYKEDSSLANPDTSQNAVNQSLKVPAAANILQSTINTREIVETSLTVNNNFEKVVAEFPDEKPSVNPTSMASNYSQKI